MKEMLEFYDVKTRSKFRSSTYRIETRTAKGRKRYFAVNVGPDGRESWRIVSKAFAFSMVARDAVESEAPVQKFSEELARVEPTFGPSYIVSTGRWTQILKRIASLENEVEGERDMQRQMGLEIAQRREHAADRSIRISKIEAKLQRANETIARQTAALVSREHELEDALGSLEKEGGQVNVQKYQIAQLSAALKEERDLLHSALMELFKFRLKDWASPLPKYTPPYQKEQLGYHDEGG